MADTLVKNALRTIFGKSFSRIRAGSEPEPDIAIVTGTPQVYRDEHPTAAELVIEIADTTLA